MADINDPIWILAKIDIELREFESRMREIILSDENHPYNRSQEHKDVVKHLSNSVIARLERVARDI